jgi:hypothetical protein
VKKRRIRRKLQRVIFGNYLAIFVQQNNAIHCPRSALKPSRPAFRPGFAAWLGAATARQRGNHSIPTFLLSILHSKRS